MPIGCSGASISDCRQNEWGSWAYIFVAVFLSFVERKCRLLIATGGVWVGLKNPAVSVMTPASVRASYSAERVLLGQSSFAVIESLRAAAWAGALCFLP